MVWASMPMSASTELTEFLYLFRDAKNTAPLFGAPSADSRGHMPPALLPAATVNQPRPLNSKHYANMLPLQLLSFGK